MIKVESIKPITRSRSSSSYTDSDDDNSTSSSSDSDLSLIETSIVNSSKLSLKNHISTSTTLIHQGTIIRDVNNNPWMIHQCIKGSPKSGRFIYLCSQVKRSAMNHESNLCEQNLVKTKISPITYLTDKLKRSRQVVIEKARAENDKLDYIFYGAVIGDTNKEIELILPDKIHPKSTGSRNRSSPMNNHVSSSDDDLNSSRMIHGVVEFLQDDETYDESQVNKYAIEILFIQEKNKINLIHNPSEVLQQILKKEIDKLKDLRRNNPISSHKANNDIHQFIVTKKPGQNQYEIKESSIEEGDPTTPSPTIESSSVKYLLKLELSNSSTSKCFTIEHEISFYSRFATHDKLKTYVKRHGLMYIAIPEYIAHGTYKHANQTYRFLIMEQYRENLRSLIYSYDQSLPEHNALNLFLQMLFVIQFIHENNYVHHIIKPKYLMFANKQPYFIFLTQCRTIRSLQETKSSTNFHHQINLIDCLRHLDSISNENRLTTITNENLHLKQQNHQVKKKVKRSHRTQLAAIHNKTTSVVPSILPVVDIPSPIVEEDQSLSHIHKYHHPYSIFLSLDIHINNKQTYRGDLEMLGYNLIVWSGGQLPWDKKNSCHHHSYVKLEHHTITNEKKLAKSNVNEFVKKCFFKRLISPVTLRAICDYMSTVYQLSIDDIPNFDQLRAPIKEIVKALGFKANACLRLSNSKSKTAQSLNGLNSNSSNSSSKINLLKNLNHSEKQLEAKETDSPAKELEIERDDLDDGNADDEEDEDEEEDYENESRPCPTGSSSSDDGGDDDDEDEDDVTSDEDAQMEQQPPSVSTTPSLGTICKRCGGDHSFEDQQSQTSSDKLSNSSGLIVNNSNNNALTYQQKRQRSIAKRLQLRRKKKN